MKKFNFEDANILTTDSVIQLFGNWFLKLDLGTVLLVRSGNVPDLGDHFIVVTGEPIMKEHGLRPQTLTIKAPNCSSIIDAFTPENGSVVLMLKPYTQKLFLNYYDIRLEEGKVRYSNLHVVKELLNVFDMFRMSPTKIDRYDEIGKGILSQRILKFVENNEPIKFSMLGYPFKSGNTHDKVLGAEPDMAEYKSFENFAKFNKIMKQIYTPGVTMSIISDGYIFSDVFGVPDKQVEVYNEITRDMSLIAPAVKMYDGTDFYGHSTPEVMREKVMLQYGITHERLTQRILTDLNVNELYRGMIIFMQEENKQKQYPSNTQREKAAKILAREAMLRNEAYSTLIQHEFDDHIRLSMHNSTNDGVKFSFKLLEGNSKYSPWHSALLMHKDNTFETIHKIDAINAGHELVYVNNKPEYFQEI